VPKTTADELEITAVVGATEAFKALRGLDKRKSIEEISFLASCIPPCWELPEVLPERRELFGLFSED